MGTLGVQRYSYKLNNLDMIISVGYRVKSQRGIIFRRWANKVLKEYLIQGYSINNKRLEKLNKVIDIQNKMLASALNIDNYELSEVIKTYTNALDLLDDYDHERLEKPKGNETIYKIEYIEARRIIDSMKFNNDSNLFGVEKENGKLVISNNTLVAITLLTAESKPDEMEIIINVIMHLLSDNNE